VAVRNFYVILGVPREVSPRAIRTAYLDLAKKHHPDRVGEGGKEAFQDVQEAYETLSDPDKRRRYNSLLDESERQSRSRRWARKREVMMSEPISIFEQPHTVHPSFEAFFDRWMRNFTGINVPKGERVEGLNIEIVLTPEEAEKGVVVPIEVPTFHKCPFCDGMGHDWVFPCTYCSEEGVVEKKESIRVDVPPMVKPGTVYEFPLKGLGVHNFYLRLHIFIE
jgi:DnaJ-class molecular chaperone